MTARQTPTRRRCDPRFGRNFDDVLIHTGPQADAAAASVQARAFTVGRHVVFADDQYQPATNDGRRLLAHELSHVVQQGGERPLGHGAAVPGLQRQADPAPATRPGLLRGTPVRGSCSLASGAFAWAIVPGSGSLGACFRVQIVFFPGRIDVLRAGTGFLSPSVGARWVPDARPVALVQTVAALQGGFGQQPAVDATSRNTAPYYGARWDSAGSAWADEPTATQDGCPSLPEAVASSGYSGGSRFSRAGSYGAVINDSPMTNVGERKDFQTTAVVMQSAQPLGSLAWSVMHDGTSAVVGSVTCHDNPQRNVPFGTPGHHEMLDDFYRSSPRSVVDGFASDPASLARHSAALATRTVNTAQLELARAYQVEAKRVAAKYGDGHPLARALAARAQAGAQVSRVLAPIAEVLTVNPPDSPREGATLSGRVVNDRGLGLGDHTIELLRANATPVETVGRTDASGYFSAGYDARHTALLQKEGKLYARVLDQSGREVLRDQVALEFGPGAQLQLTLVVPVRAVPRSVAVTGALIYAAQAPLAHTPAAVPRTPLDKLGLDDATHQQLWTGGVNDVEAILEAAPEKLTALAGGEEKARALTDAARQLLAGASGPVAVGASTPRKNTTRKPK
ncbi:DUF4157 domain-containing protein [Massilia sp. CCM 9210]|uniref:eCIS core domain-containing protein n=1 Tax=Massilia scottii TaxID=3057166 RepID=UPI002796BC28|nr:DUF4157 domain-containing protein [Massilia sp. CCM 9210]MDQ1812057.1 DUF4157 domain-containing protein [Massilia sp. CCM 9210]